MPSRGPYQLQRKRTIEARDSRHMDVPAAAGGERGAKVTPFDLKRDARDRESESSLLTAALPKQPLQFTIWEVIHEHRFVPLYLWRLIRSL